jgi:small subunit ribosomal protein S1
MPKKQAAAPVQDDSLMGQLLAKATVDLPKVGATIEGSVISASRNEVIVDIGGIVTGIIRGFGIDESAVTLKRGDKITASVVEVENEDGDMELSMREASQRLAWDYLADMVKQGDIVDAEIVDANRGGLMVRVERVSGFLPVSQLAPQFYPRVEGGDKNKILEILSSYVGQKMPVKVIDADPEEEKLIVSGKDAWAEQEKETLAQYKVGDKVTGRITGVVDFGAFMEFGTGLEGLIHISEIAWQRIENPRDYLQKDQEVEAQIIQVDGTKISLSLKRLADDPWQKAVEKYKVGDVVKGKVLKINSFGVFVELDDQIHGLAHVSELSSKKVADAKEVVKEGEECEFKIITIEPTEHRLGLSIKALERAKKKAAKDEGGKEDEEKKPAKSKKKEVVAEETAAPEEKKAE